MKIRKLERTDDKPIERTYRWKSDARITWRRDNPIVDALAHFSWNTGIKDISVDELAIRQGKRKHPRRFRIRVANWLGTVPKYGGLLTMREVYHMLEEVPYFTVAAIRYAMGMTVEIENGFEPGEEGHEV